MENVHKVTRPAWTVNFRNTWFISAGTIASALLFTGVVADFFKSILRPHSNPQSLDSDSLVFAGIVLTIAISLIVTLLIKWRTPKPDDRYPRSFVYCFQKRRQVYAMGTFTLTFDTNSGEMQADGYAYDAHVKDPGGFLEKVEIPDGASKREWHSLHIGASVYRDLNTCYIAFKFDPPEHADYLYGLIRFQKLTDDGYVNHKTAYHGNINGIAPPDGHEQSGNLPIYPRAYAELIDGKIEVNDLLAKLNEYAPKLKDATGRIP